ncbi:MAG TPA: phosphate/phosphite/phosphonate ABC transporter substrate-binding protein [Dehalococcoidia bacterium]|nr:phosphate/phosphite/phosphonate ABC transporter substrate-binding protein [Dehalococcoidia bacterium]
MNASLKSAGILLLTLVSAFMVACGGGQDKGREKLVIAIQPTQAATEMLEKAKPLERYLEERLQGVDVEIYVPLSQSGVIEALRFGQADIAFMGAWPAQLAVERAGAELALAEVREVSIGSEKQERPYYFSYWVVPKSSAATSLTDLRGKKACFPSAVSGSGYVGPMGRLVELGYVSKPEAGKEANPKSFFGDVVFGGGYQQCWEALRSGQVDVTVIAGDVSASLYNEVLGATRVLEQQGPLPSHAVLLSKDLREPLRTRAVEALMGLGDPQYRDLMRGFISGIFVRFEKSDAATHLSAFKGYLALTGLAFTETVR